MEGRVFSFLFFPFFFVSLFYFFVICHPLYIPWMLCCILFLFSIFNNIFACLYKKKTNNSNWTCRGLAVSVNPKSEDLKGEGKKL